MNQRFNLWKIGFIGAGQMGGAILNRICNSKLFLSEFVNVCEKNPAKVRHLGVNLMKDVKQTVEESEIVVCAIKPQQVDKLMQEVKLYWKPEKIFISICAGIPMSSFLKVLGYDAKVVRTMPSITCLTGKGSTTITFSNLDEDEKSYIKSIFNCCGNVHIIDEKIINATTAISGSGPAFTAYFIEALIDSGVYNGVNRELATSLAVETIEGTCALIKEMNIKPPLIKEKVTSPGGTTIAGIYSLEKHGFKASVMECVNSAVARAKELGQ